MSLDIVDSIAVSNRWDEQCVLAIDEIRGRFPDNPIYLDKMSILEDYCIVCIYSVKTVNGVQGSIRISFTVEDKSDLPKIKLYLESMGIVPDKGM